MSTPEHGEVARLLLAKARADLAATRLLASDPAQDDGVIGFHAQQAAEKALKAVLARQGDIPRTHDLEYLLELVKAHSGVVPAQVAEIAWLNPWAVTMRYDLADAALDRRAALASAEAAVDWASSISGPDG